MSTVPPPPRAWAALARRLAAALALAGLAHAPPAAAQETRAPEAQAPLIVGYTYLPPFMYRYADGARGGFAVELAEMLGAEIGVEVRYLETGSVRDAVAAQVSGDSHMIAGIARLAQLEGVNVFSAPVGAEPLRLIVRAGDEDAPASPDIAGRRIGVVPPAVGSDVLTLLSANVPVSHATSEAALMHLISGDLDAVLNTNPSAFELARRAGLDHRIAFVDPPVRTVVRVVALHDSRADLLPAIDAAIARLEEDGRLEALRRKHFIELPAPEPEVLTFGVAHLPPYMIVKPDGSFSGFAVEALQDLAEIVGLKLELREAPRREWADGPTQEDFDLTVAPVTYKRRERMDFTAAIGRVPARLHVRAGADATEDGAADLAGLTVGVVRRSGAYPLVVGDDAKEGGAVVVAFETLPDLLTALTDGTIDAAASTEDALMSAAEARG
ncbi:MAG: transporter substrate-binding domain-containing protein, partial [Pseudomonadota bacterium]